MSDSVKDDSLDTIREELDQRFPGFFARYLRGADNIDGLIGVVFDLYASVPNLASPAFIFLAERLQGRGGVLGLFGQFVNTIPSTSRTLRAITGKTPEAARADVVAHWKRFRNNPSIGATMATPAAATAAPTPTPTPTPAAVPLASYSKVQRALSKAAADGGYSDDQQIVLLYMFRIMRIEATPGTDIIAELEGEAAVAKLGLLNTLKDNADDLKHRLSGPDFEAAIAFVKEMRDFENRGCQSGDNLKGWRCSAEGFVRRLIPAFEFLLIGQADRNQGSDAIASGLDMLDRLHLFAGLQPSSAFVKAQAFMRKLALASKGSAAILGGLILYGLLTLWIASAHEAWLPSFAWWSTVIILGVSALMMAFGWFKSGMVQVIGVLLGFYAAPAALTLVWVITAIFASTVEWFAYWVSLLVVIAFDFVSINLLQKGVQTAGAIPAFIKSVIKMEKEQVDALSKEMAKTNFLVNISSTISSAVVLAWIPLTLAFALGTPQEWRIGGVAFIAIFAIAYGYLKRGATLKVYSSYAAELAPEIKAHDILNLRYAYNALRVVTLAVLAAFIVVRVMGVQWISQAEASVSHGTVRAAEVVGHGGSRVLDYAEKAVGKPAAQEESEAPAPVVVKASKPKTKAEKAAAIKKYCDENPVDQSSTCKK